jgi:hypothetical protein
MSAASNFISFQIVENDLVVMCLQMMFAGTADQNDVHGRRSIATASRTAHSRLPRHVVASSAESSSRRPACISGPETEQAGKFDQHSHRRAIRRTIIIYLVSLCAESDRAAEATPMIPTSRERFASVN